MSVDYYDKPVLASRRLWSLREDVLVELGDDELVAITPWGEIHLHQPEPWVRESLRRMSLGPVSLINVMQSWRRAPDDCHEWRSLGAVLDMLRGSVVQSLAARDAHAPVLSAVPLTRGARFAIGDVPVDTPIRLSRFAAMRNDGGLVLESPLAQYRVVLHRPVGAALVAALGSATTITEAGAVAGVDLDTTADVMCYLVAAGMVVVGRRDAASYGVTFDEDTDPALMSWSPHDLFFHSRSRMGRFDGAFGSVFPHLDRLAPEPATKPPPAGGPVVPLHRPSLDAVADTDPALTDVLEARRPFTGFGDAKVTAEMLGELLFRTARVRAVDEAVAAPGVTYEVSDRPYPSNAGLYELEVYVTVDREMDGLARGVYHYDPRDHALTLVNTERDDLDDLLDTAMVTAGAPDRPPVLVTITARIARLSWVYGAAAYALALKDVGVLQQTVHLVATAMGLDPVALSVGDSEAASHALRLDWPAEVSVGEIAIGGGQ